MSSSLGQQSVKSRTESSNSRHHESFVYILGDEQSGKTTAIHKFLSSNKLQSGKNDNLFLRCQGLNYTYARKDQDIDSNVKSLANIWEFSGPRSLTSQLLTTENVFLSAKHVTTAVILIVLDLSKPETCFESGMYWLKHIEEKLKVVYKKLQDRGSRLPDQLKARSRKTYYSNNTDKDMVLHTGIQLLLLGNKCDQVQHEQKDKQEILSKSLRILAHNYGAHLLYVSGLEDSQKLKRSSRNSWNQNSDKFRSLLTHMMFHGFDKKLSASKFVIEKDYLKPLFILAGTDDLDSIGFPCKVKASLAVATALNSWQQACQHHFGNRNANFSNFREQVEHYESWDKEIDELISSKIEEENNG